MWVLCLSRILVMLYHDSCMVLGRPHTFLCLGFPIYKSVIICHTVIGKLNEFTCGCSQRSASQSRPQCIIFSFALRLFLFSGCRMRGDGKNRAEMKEEWEKACRGMKYGPPPQMVKRDILPWCHQKWSFHCSQCCVPSSLHCHRHFAFLPWAIKCGSESFSKSNNLHWSSSSLKGNNELFITSL